MTNQNQDYAKPQYLVIVIMMVAAIISYMNETMLNVALPTIMEDLSITAGQAQWLTTAYMLVNAIVIPATAFMIRKYSVRKLFLTAMTFFTLGTAIAGFAGSFEVLLGARVLQATGAAITMPLLMNFMFTSFPPEQRGKAMGFFGIAFMMAPAIGPTLAGLLLETHDWTFLFRLVLPFAIAILVIGFILLKDDKETNKSIKLDITSLIISSFAFGGILLGFHRVGEHAGDANPWLNPDVIGIIAIGFIALAILVRRSFKQENPMLSFRVYQSRDFALSSALMIINSMSMFSAMMLLPMFMQTVLGMSSLEAGIAMLPGAVLMGILMPVTGILYDKIGAKILAVGGFAIVTFATVFYTQLSLETTLGAIVVIYAIRMVGISMINMPITTNGLNSLQKDLYPHGTAMNSTMMQVAGAVGSALLVSVLSVRTRMHAEELVADVQASMIGQAPEAIQAAAEQAVLQATVNGMNDAFMVSVLLSVIGFILAFFIRKVTPPEGVKRGPGAGH